jgi:hypothetical protein
MYSFISKNKFEKLVHLVGFIIRKFVTVYGHMNVKLLTYVLLTETWTSARKKAEIHTN